MKIESDKVGLHLRGPEECDGIAKATFTISFLARNMQFLNENWEAYSSYVIVYGAVSESLRRI